MATEKKTRGRKKKEVVPAVQPQEKLAAVQIQPGGVFNKRGVKSLDELLGERHSPYTHQTEEEYVTYLNTLNLTDLQEHAASLSVLPKDDRRAMINLLVREYKVRNSDYFNSSVVQPGITKPISPEVLRILAEGR